MRISAERQRAADQLGDDEGGDRGGRDAGERVGEHAPDVIAGLAKLVELVKK